MPPTSTPAYEVVDSATLPQRFADAEWLEAPITDGVSPLTVIDLSRPGSERFGGRPSATNPRVFVAFGGRGTALRDALDVAIDDDVDGHLALTLMAETCAIAPQAASVAAQLLRTADTGTLAEALWRESVTYSMLLAGPEFRDWRRRHRRHKRAGDELDDDFPVEVDDQGDLVDIVLNRPRVHNAYNAAMRDALVAILRLLDRAKDRPMVRLRGNGRSFCSGGDLDEFGTTPDVVLAHGVRTNRAPGVLLDAFGSLATASVHGSCVGAGTELPAFCARVEAAPDARFRLPEVAMGLVPGAGGTVSVTRRIGRQRTALLALSGLTIDAHTALEWGLIDAVVP
jgi:enoyl-CoA hydratase/carnithine racemase